MILTHLSEAEAHLKAQVAGYKPRDNRPLALVESIDEARGWIHYTNPLVRL